MRNDKNVDHIDTVYRQLKDLFEEGNLPLELYNKGLLSLAYEYILSDDINSTIQMVSECEKSYICNKMSLHMDDDSKFKTCVKVLVEMIEKQGLKLTEIVDDEEAFWLSRTSGSETVN